MKRCLFTTASAGSLLLFVALAALWASSYVRCGEVRVGTGRPYGVFFVVAGTGPGQVRVGTVREELTGGDTDPRRGRRVVWRRMSYSTADGSGRPRTTFLGRRGFDRIAFVGTSASLGHTGRPARFTFDTIGVPLWLPTGAAALLPALRLRARRRLRRRVRLGLCVHCGYDLRASSGRCPECGEPGSGTMAATPVAP